MFCVKDKEFRRTCRFVLLSNSFAYPPRPKLTIYLFLAPRIPHQRWSLDIDLCRVLLDEGGLWATEPNSLDNPCPLPPNFNVDFWRPRELKKTLGLVMAASSVTPNIEEGGSGGDGLRERRAS